MDKSFNNMSEQLVLYLDGVLTGAAKTEIERLLVFDIEIQAEYENLMQTRAAIRNYGLKQQVADVHKRMVEEIKPLLKQRRKAKKIIRYSMAAAAGLVLLIGSYLAYNFLSLSSDKVFSSNYTRYELSITREITTHFTPVEKAYSEKNYKEVLRIHDAKEDKTAKAEFLTGVASLETKNNSKAIKCFNEVIDMNKKATIPELNDESEYYLALAYINNKDYDFALLMLQKIKENDEHKYNSAVSSKLIRQVKMLK